MFELNWENAGDKADSRWPQIKSLLKFVSCGDMVTAIHK